MSIRFQQSAQRRPRFINRLLLVVPATIVLGSVCFGQTNASQATRQIPAANSQQTTDFSQVPPMKFRPAATATAVIKPTQNAPVTLQQLFGKPTPKPKTRTTVKISNPQFVRGGSADPLPRTQPDSVKHRHQLPTLQTNYGVLSAPAPAPAPSLVQQATFVAPVPATARVTQSLAAPQQDSPQGSPVQGVEGLKGQVFIFQDPETGVITLSGDNPEDVEKVKAEIAKLSKQVEGNLPTPFRISLSNVRGNAIETRVQEIYDASYLPITGPAKVTAIDNPNSLVVIGSPAAIEAVQKLVQQIDVKPEDTQVRDFQTFRLKYISSTDAATRLGRYFGQISQADEENRIPSSAVEIIPDYRSNQVTVKGSQSILAAAATYLSTIDVESVDNGAVNEVRVIQLKNALATTIAFVIQNAINGQQPNSGETFAPSTNQGLGGGQQQNQQAQAVADPDGLQSQLRSSMLALMTRGDNGQMIKSGILFDVRITADENSNSLVITGPAASIPLVEQLVKQLDRIPDAETQIKVFELVYSDAETILGMLETLFNGQAQNGGFQQQQAGGVSQLPLQSNAGSDGASLVNLRFSVEPRSNAIIASGPASDLQVVEDLLNRLDARAINSYPGVVHRLSNAPAQDVADAINAYLEGRTELIENDPRTSSGVAATNRTIIVTPEVVSNSLIVSALPEYRQEIEDIIKSLDRRPPMIKVKVLIAEVNLSTLEEFGVELGLQDSLLFDRGTSIAADGALSGIGFPFNTGTAGNANAFARELVAGQALSNLNVGRVNTNLGYGGLVLSAGNESVSVLMRALKDRQCVRVLSKPHIMTMENLQGRVAIGASVARIAGTTQSNFGVTQDVTFQDVGVILEVTPRVSPDGLIVLSVNAEKSSVGPEETGTVIGVGANGDIVRTQQILKTEANTTLSARSGQTVVFSGLINEEKTHVERGAPILSDLPVIGPLFKFESDSASRTELMIFMTPYLVTSDDDIANLNQDEMERMHWCMSDVADVYGNTDFGGIAGTEEAIETYYPDADPTGLTPIEAPAMQNSRLNTSGNRFGETGMPATNGMNDFHSKNANRSSGGQQQPAAKTAKRPWRSMFNKR